MLEQTIESDLKAALLAGNKQLVMTLRGLKSSLLYAKIAANSRDKVMTDEAVVAVLQKEAKKRGESAELYRRGGSTERAEAELAEKAVIERYLPQALTETEVARLVDDAIAEINAQGLASMGQVIASTKQKASGRADGATIARIVRERLSQ